VYPGPVPVPFPAIELNFREFIKGFTIGIHIHPFLKILSLAFSCEFINKKEARNNFIIYVTCNFDFNLLARYLKKSYPYCIILLP
jgi:hypothetical protein